MPDRDPFFCLHITWVGGTDPRTCLKAMNHQGEHGMTPMADTVRSKFVHHHQLQGLCRAIYVPEPEARPLVCLRDAGHLTPHGLPEGRTEGAPRAFVNTEPVTVKGPATLPLRTDIPQFVVTNEMLGRPAHQLQDQEMLGWPPVEDEPMPWPARSEDPLWGDLRDALSRYPEPTGTAPSIRASFLMDVLRAFGDATETRDGRIADAQGPSQEDAAEALRAIRKLLRDYLDMTGGAGGARKIEVLQEIWRLVSEVRGL